MLTADLKYVAGNIADLPRLFLNNRDILFNRTNSYELVGKAGIFLGVNGRFTFASYLIRLRTCVGVMPEYVNIVLNSPFFRLTQIEPEITQQNGQANFNGTKLRQTLIPLPPEAEQRRIVATVAELMTTCDCLEVQLSSERVQAGHLAASVVQHLTAA